MSSPSNQGGPWISGATDISDGDGERFKKRFSLEQIIISRYNT
jgi:hypothetical protein